MNGKTKENMTKMMNRLLTLLLVLIGLNAFGQLRDSVYVKTDIFEVVYSEKLEQPKWLKYQSLNRPKNVDRTGLDFYTIKGVHTSDGADYKANVYDKGHLAPAASFADSEENMKATFSYLNCALQHQDLNRGEWRLLEEQERNWDAKENLEITVECVFGNNPQKLSTGASIPTKFKKHIHFKKSNKWQCYEFPNQTPSKKWSEYLINCTSVHR